MFQVMLWRRVSLLFLLGLALVGFGDSDSARAELFLPGTQPNENGIELGRVAQCVLCHSGTTNGEADPYFSWSGGMMAQAARDPVFRAALAIANQDIKGCGEYCIRCHTPKGWLAGRSAAADASLLNREDLHGVSCDACHHLVDPLSAEAHKLAQHAPPGYGDGMYVADPENVARGPYGDCKGAMPHQTARSPYHATSELCANCHDVSNPLQALNVTNQPPYAFGHIERTYSEWALSDFAKPGSGRTCQSCHLPRVASGGQASKYGSPHRDYFVRHGEAGGSTWVQDAVFKLWKGKDLDREALDAGKRHARELLRTSAALHLECTGGKARLTITNLTGHKLPTGYPEGRRMWVNIRFLGPEAKLLGEAGRYGEVAQKLAGTNVSAPTLLDPDKTRVYECLPGISKAQGEKFKQPPGASFHFIINDVIAKDNRIPPQGFIRTKFAGHLSAPVGAEYADGQYWDTVEFEAPPGTERVEARLMYQSISWEYLKFLVEENRSDNWGKDIYAAWNETGKCPPEEIAVARAYVPR